MSEKQVEFRVQSVAKMKFDNHFFGANLCSKFPKSNLVSICWSTKSELDAELLRQRFLQADRGLVVEFRILLDDAVRAGNFLLGERLHSNQQSAAFAFATGPILDMFIKLPPGSQVEVSDAKV
ncbi:MAG TPA: hypothetical protein VI320_29835 [Terracidiphilus sp.]